MQRRNRGDASDEVQARGQVRLQDCQRDWCWKSDSMEERLPGKYKGCSQKCQGKCSTQVQIQQEGWGSKLPMTRKPAQTPENQGSTRGPGPKHRSYNNPL